MENGKERHKDAFPERLGSGGLCFLWWRAKTAAQTSVFILAELKRYRVKRWAYGKQRNKEAGLTDPCSSLAGCSFRLQPSGRNAVGSYYIHCQHSYVNQRKAWPAH